MTMPFPDLMALLRQGEQAAARHQWDEARRCFESVVAKEEHPDALVHLSYLASKADRYRDGLDYTLRALRAKPKQPRTLIQVLNRLRNFNQTWAMQQLIETSPALFELDPRGLHAVSAQLSYLGEQERALAFLDKAIRQQPWVPQLRLARGQILIFLGRFDEAERDLESCVSMAPDFAPAWWTLAQLGRSSAERNPVDVLRRQLSSTTDPAARAYLGFALHKVLDDLGEVDSAFEALAEACKAKRGTLEYDDRQSQELADALRGTDFSSIREATGVEVGFTPVFIVGMFRSGTTLLEQLLGANPSMLNAGELYDIPSSLRYATDHQSPAFLDLTTVERARSADFSELAQSYVRGVSWRLREQTTHLTDKLPPNFWMLGYICKAFPNARILHMVRDPVETCFSNLRELFSGAGQYSYDQRELASYYRRYESLMAHWHRVFPGRILDVHYRDLTTDTETVIRRVAEHCGLGFLPSMVDPLASGRSVATASVVQVRSPVVARKVAKWEPYRAHLQPLIQGLAESGHHRAAP